MKRTFATITLVAAAGLTPTAAHAAGAPPGEGRSCEFISLNNLFADGRQTGEIDAGPIVIADGTDPRAGRVICSIQLNALQHSAPDVYRVSSLTTPGLVALPPTPFEYQAEDWDWIVLCTEVEIEGAGTFYWDDFNSVWSTDASTSCYSLIDPPPPDRDPFEEFVDPVVCPVFVSLAPGVPGIVDIRYDGDVYVLGTWIWDCPPYDNG